MICVGIYGFFGIQKDIKTMTSWKETKCTVIKRIFKNSREIEGRLLNFYQYNVTYPISYDENRNSMSIDEVPSTYTENEKPTCKLLKSNSNSSFL